MNTETLRTLIRINGMTLEQVAEICGISKVSLCNILRGGDCRVSTLRAIAEGLKVHPSVLLC